MIHATAIVGPGVDLVGVHVGPWCALGVDGPGGADLRIGPGSLLRSHSVVYRGCEIGPQFSAGHGVLVREYTSIGVNVSIGSHTVVEHHVVIGDGVRLHSRCFVPEWSVLEEGAWVGPGVILTNARYPNRPDTKEHLQGVVIRRGAVVGAGAVLLPGVVVGAGALVGAGSVVVHHVDEGTTVVGNPARAMPRGAQTPS